MNTPSKVPKVSNYDVFMNNGPSRRPVVAGAIIVQCFLPTQPVDMGSLYRTSDLLILTPLFQRTLKTHNYGRPM